MLPILYTFTFDSALSRALLVVFAAGLVAYAGWLGWRGSKRANERADQRLPRAAGYAAVAAALAWLGLFYVLPEVPLLGRGKGLGIPIHTYGVLVGGGFMAAVTLASHLARREWPGAEADKRAKQIYDLAFRVLVSR